MNKTEVFLRKHSSTILTVVGSVGVVATTVLAVKATPKAMMLLEEAKEEKGDELTVVETIQAAWKPYIPATISGISTIACIFGIKQLSARNQASLMSAYALLDNSYKEYRKKVEELYGENSDLNVKKEIVKAKYGQLKDVYEEEGKDLFFDFGACRYFWSTEEEINRAEYQFNQILTMSGFACVNDFYDLLGLEHTDSGFQLGWSSFENDDLYGLDSFEVTLEKVDMEDGMECWIMTYPCPPTFMY